MTYTVVARDVEAEVSALCMSSEAWWDILLLVRLANALDEPTRRSLYVVGSELEAADARGLATGVRQYLEGREEDLGSRNGTAWELSVPGRPSAGRPVRVARETLDKFLELAESGGFRVL